MKEPLRTRKKRETRAIITNQAAQIFEQKGFDATTLEEIAEASNIHKQTVLRYFCTKEEIAFARRIAICEEFEADLLENKRLVLDFWRSYIKDGVNTRANPNISKGDELRSWYDFIDSDHRLYAYQLKLNERYQAALARAFSIEAGAPPDTDIFAMSLAALLVTGNYNVARNTIKNGDESKLSDRLLNVIDIGAQLKRQ